MSTTEIVTAGLPATIEPAAVPQVAELEIFRQLGRWLSLAELDEKTEASRGAAAALRFALANMLGVSPTAALTELSFIHGRLNLSAQLVRALALKRGYRVVRIESNEETCTAAIIEKATGQELGRTTYTIEDARRAGLIRDGGGYKKTPARMLWARASKRVVDDFAPEVSLGITTPEEEEEITLEPLPPDPTERFDEQYQNGDDAEPELPPSPSPIDEAPSDLDDIPFGT